MIKEDGLHVCVNHADKIVELIYHNDAYTLDLHPAGKKFSPIYNNSVALCLASNSFTLFTAFGKLSFRFQRPLSAWSAFVSDSLPSSRSI
jgi:hypothetical protein